MQHFRIVTAGLCLAATALLTACNSSSNSSSVSTGWVQVFNALGASQAVDCQMSGTILATALPAGQASSYTIETAGTTASFSAFDTGTSALVASTSYPVGTGNYSVVLAGIPGSATYPPALFVLDDNNQTPGSDSCSVRVINASPDAGPASFSLSTITATWASITYKSQGIYQTITPGSYTQAVTGSSTSTPIATGSAYSFLGGHSYTMALYGSISNGTLAIMVHQDL